MLRRCSMGLVRNGPRDIVLMCVWNPSRFSVGATTRMAASRHGGMIVCAYGSEEGIAYGEGRGTATGRIEGTVVWSNYPRRRTDGRMLPNLRGLITTMMARRSSSSSRANDL